MQEYEYIFTLENQKYPKITFTKMEMPPVNRRGHFIFFKYRYGFGGTRVPPFCSTAISGEVNTKIYLM